MNDQTTNPATVEPSVVDLLISPIESRLKEATEGPWAINSCIADCCVYVASEVDPDYQFAGFDNVHNADFIAHARTDVAALIALARQQNEKLMEILQLVESSEEDRRIRQDGQPFAQFADSVIGTDEIRAVLNKTSES